MNRFALPSLFLAALAMILVGCQAVPNNPMTLFDSVSTSIADAYPTSAWLQQATQGRTPQPLQGNRLAPGFYTVDVQSYCLHAGAYGPTRGAGYEIGPVNGRDAPAILHVLRASADHPDIDESDVQRLVWIIEAHELNASMDPAFAARVAPLLAGLQVAASSAASSLPVRKLLPSWMTDALSSYHSLTRKLTDMSVSFDRLERIAVPQAGPAAAAAMRRIAPGHWAYVSAGYYLRAYPHGYSRTTLQVLRPAPFTIERDARGRMSTLHVGDTTAHVQYAPGEPVPLTASTAPATLAVWPVRQVRITDAQGMHTLKSVPPMPAIPKQSGGVDEFFKQINQLHHDYDYIKEAGRNSGQVPAPHTRIERLHSVIDFADHVRETYDTIRDEQQELDLARHPSEQALRDFTDLEFYRQGLQTASNITDKVGQALWLHKLLERGVNAVYYAGCVLEGRCAAPGMDQPLPEFDPTGLAALPGDTGAQRLGLSLRRYRED